MRRNGDGPVVGLDLDGTLFDYHRHFLSFAEGWYGRPMPNPEDAEYGLPLHKFMRTSKSTYRRCKLAYRLGGLKRSMPMYEGADRLTQELRKDGCEIWIATTRPYLKVDNIDPDTRECLRRNHIQYDGIIYGEHKYRDLRKQVGLERIVCVMDDLPEMVMQATSLGMHGVVRAQPYNRAFPWHLRAVDMDDALEGIRYRLKEWRWKHEHR
jgi:FMN phosphatase YigB (HAD superfamily)